MTTILRLSPDVSARLREKQAQARVEMRQKGKFDTFHGVPKRFVSNSKPISKKATHSE